ncbi:hypothetical protein F511_18056 [Dorcoceras hygrometricum]|uniref:Uncharacterized protein n=1 Tax=Dorcoceras hygrometricum TaxID=472368 RepID=A0A2Z7D602_9LAMI|nr:hypothetical protein F511_18056 [Dorcoceras hygrometricum]
MIDKRELSDPWLSSTNLGPVLGSVKTDPTGDVARRFTMIRWAIYTPPPSSQKPPPPSPPRADAAAAVFAGKIVSGQLDEENPFVLISSGLLVQPDEGVSDLVVDRIGVNYRNLPRRAELFPAICLLKFGAEYPTLSFFRNGKDPLEDLDYSSSRYNPIQQPSALISVLVYTELVDTSSILLFSSSFLLLIIELLFHQAEDQASESLDHILLELDTAGQTAGTMEVGESSKQTVASKRSFEELMSVDDLLVQICDDMMLPSITDAEISKIRIDSLETAVKRRLYILARYREMLLRKLLDSHRQYLVSGQPWTATASQIFDLLSAVHSKSLEALRILQQDHGIIFEQPCTSTAFDYAVDCGAVFAQFFSVAKSTCWVRPMIFVDGIWTPLQGPDFWRSGCRLSLFLNKVEMPAPAVQDIFVHSVLLIEPVQYWGAAPFLPKTWAWHFVCTEVFPFSISGRLRSASCSTDLFVYSLDVQKLPAYLLDDFQRGVLTDCFAGYFGGSVVLSDSEILSDSSNGCTVYRSPSPVENPFALGPAIFSRVDHAEQLYFVQSPVSPPAAFSHQESSSSSSDVSIHFDSEDLPMRTPEAAHTSAPVDSNVSTAALDDLKSYFSQRIDESTTELRSKVNEVEFNVRGDLVKQQAWLRQVFQSACDILERQTHEAKLNALDGQVAALRNDQLEFQNRISADLLSLSTQFAVIVEFIRGGDAKNGESGSSSRPPPVRVERRPLPIPPSPRDVAGSSGAVRIPTFPRTTGTFEERVEQARRHLLESGLVISVEEAAERIRQADFQESDRFQRERERARREKRSSSSRRRRGL